MIDLPGRWPRAVLVRVDEFPLLMKTSLEQAPEHKHNEYEIGVFSSAMVM